MKLMEVGQIKLNNNKDMLIEELKQTNWYKSRPKIIQQVMDMIHPMQFYKLKETGKQCYIISIEEPISGKFEDITFIVQKTGIGGLLEKIGLSELDTNQVFNVKFEDLEPW